MGGIRTKLQIGVNDLQTLQPELMKDWDWDANTRHPSTLQESSVYQAHWVCHKCGHKWVSRLDSRTKNFHGCPLCNQTKGSSMADYLLYFILKTSLNCEVLYRYNVLKGMEADVYIPSRKIVIEYNGYSFHNINTDKYYKDLDKYNVFKNMGLSVFVFSEREDTKKEFSLKGQICYLPYISYNEFNYLKDLYSSVLRTWNIISNISEEAKIISLQEITQVIFKPVQEKSLKTILNGNNQGIIWSSENKKDSDRVYAKSREIVWLECKYGHVFSKEARNLTRYLFCPICSHHRNYFYTIWDLSYNIPMFFENTLSYDELKGGNGGLKTYICPNCEIVLCQSMKGVLRINPLLQYCGCTYSYKDVEVCFFGKLESFVFYALKTYGVTYLVMSDYINKPDIIVKFLGEKYFNFDLDFNNFKRLLQDPTLLILSFNSLNTVPISKKNCRLYISEEKERFLLELKSQRDNKLKTIKEVN